MNNHYVVFALQFALIKATSAEQFFFAFPIPLSCSPAYLITLCDPEVISKAVSQWCWEGNCGEQIPFLLENTLISRCSSLPDQKFDRTLITSLCFEDHLIFDEHIFCDKHTDIPLVVVKLESNDCVSTQVTVERGNENVTMQANFFLGMSPEALANDFCMDDGAIDHTDGTDRWMQCCDSLTSEFKRLARENFSRQLTDSTDAIKNLPRYSNYVAMNDFLQLDTAPPSTLGCWEQSMSLSCLFSKFHTDKGYEHGFYRFYPRVFSTLRHKKDLRFLEIGVFKGASFKVWENYFTNSPKLFGIGYGEDVMLEQRKEVFNGGNTTLYLGDQSDQHFLEYVETDSGGDWDIIIDDGSHVPEHQIFSFGSLFSHLKPGGLYIFEDIETSYWNRPGAGIYKYEFAQPLGIGSSNSLVEKFKNVVDWGVNKYYHDHDEDKEGGRKGCGIPFCDEIASVMFEQNIIMIRKLDSRDIKFHGKGRRLYQHRNKTK